jgi:hypothetical protein
MHHLVDEKPLEKKILGGIGSTVWTTIVGLRKVTEVTPERVYRIVISYYIVSLEG